MNSFLQNRSFFQLKSNRQRNINRLFFFMFLFSFVLSFKSIQAQENTWTITAKNIDPANYYGETVANGMIGIISSPIPLKAGNVVLASTYDLYGRGRVSNFLQGFNLLNLNLEIDGETVTNKNITNFTQCLNMKEATFEGSFDFKNKATVKYKYLALRQLPYCVLMDISIHATKTIEIKAINQLQTPDEIRDVQNYQNEISRPHANIALMTSIGKSPNGKLSICASTCFLFQEPIGNEPAVLHEMWDSNMHRLSFTRQIKAAEDYSFSLLGTTITSAHNPDPLNESERLTIFANLEGHDRLLEKHKNAWSELWKSDILIEGDDNSQRDIHNMLYHLYAFYREGSQSSISPMGLSGLGYNGHVFWDTDIWMFPVYLLLQPEMAKSLLEYRFNRLAIARENAFAHGYKGAMFPWESAETGVEETPVWALSGPFEHHITACVAFAFWEYYCITQDKEWLKEKGWPVLSATADFWTSRVELNSTGKYDIKNVVAADEWAENIDNDAFTNAIAIQNLTFAMKAAQILGLKPNPDWSKVAQNIVICIY